MSEEILFVILPYKTIPEKNTTHRLQSYVAFPYGVISMATYVKNHSDAKIKVFDCNVDSNLEEDLS